jgi:hypothetical protein
VVQPRVASHTKAIARGKCVKAVTIFLILSLIPTLTATITTSCSLFTILFGQFSHPRQRVLPAREFLGVVLANRFAISPSGVWAAIWVRMK